jgi:hypothetical protein
MTALPLALSLSDSFTKVGAIAAFAGLLGIALLALLFFAQARELKRLRAWVEAEPERAAEREQRIGAAVALRIQRATAQMARPPARAVSAAPAAMSVVAKTPALSLMPAAPVVIATGRAVAETGSAEGREAESEVQLQSEPQLVAGPRIPVSAQSEEALAAGELSEVAPSEAPAEERVPVLAAAAASATAVAATAVEAPPRAPAPPPPAAAPLAAPVVAPARRSALEAPAARDSLPDAPAGGGRGQASGGRSQPPRAGAVKSGARPLRRTRNGPPPGPPFLREERSPSRLPLLLVGGAVVAIVVVLLVVVLGSGGSSPSAGSSGAKLSSSTSSAAHSSTSAAPPVEVASAPAETHVVVLNATETAGLAHRLSTNLQQSGYTLAQPLDGTPKGHSASVVEYAPGHHADAEHVAQTLGISQVQPLESAIVAMSSGASVVVVAAGEQSASAGGEQSSGGGEQSSAGGESNSAP